MKKLLQQYANTATNLNNHQFSNLPNNIKKTYMRQMLKKYRYGASKMPHYIYNTYDDEIKDEIVGIDIKTLSSHYGQNNSHFRDYIDKEGVVLYDYVNRMLDKVKDDLSMINIIGTMVTYYADVIPVEVTKKIIRKIVSEKPNINATTWISIIDALWDAGLDVTELLKLHLKSGGSIGTNELAALTMYNNKPMEILNLLGKDKYKDIITNEKIKAGLDPKRWEQAAWNGAEAIKIKEMMGL